MSKRTYTKTVSNEGHGVLAPVTSVIDRDDLPHPVEAAFYADDAITEVSIVRHGVRLSFVKLDHETIPT